VERRRLVERTVHFMIHTDRPRQVDPMFPNMRNEFLPGQPSIEQAVDRRSGACAAWLGSGPKVVQFERDFAAYKDVPHAVALNSCTAALHQHAGSGIQPATMIRQR
jgi:hypothetical protein